MKNAVALALGIAAMIVALVVASGTTNQDTAPRPQVALVMATALHVTPSAVPTDTATPGPTFTPAPTPTPLHLVDSQPTAQEILALLFQYPQQGAIVAPGRQVAVDPIRKPDNRQAMLIVTGEGARASFQGRDAPVAYAAVLLWVNGEYVVAFEHVEFGHTDARVLYSVVPGDSTIRFVFQDIGIDPNSARELRRYFSVSCVSDGCKVIDSSAGHTI